MNIPQQELHLQQQWRALFDHYPKPQLTTPSGADHQTGLDDLCEDLDGLATVGDGGRESQFPRHTPKAL
jgi:hypothetical protein